MYRTLDVMSVEMALYLQCFSSPSWIWVPACAEKWTSVPFGGPYDFPTFIPMETGEKHRPYPPHAGQKNQLLSQMYKYIII